MFRFLLKLSLVLALVAGSAAAWAWYDYARTARSAAGIGDEPTTFTVERGWSARRLARELAARGIIDKPWWFVLDARLSGRAAGIKSGEFVLEPGTAVGELLDVFSSGRTVQYGFPVIEGSTFEELRVALARSERLEHTLAPPGPDVESGSPTDAADAADVADVADMAVGESGQASAPVPFGRDAAAGEALMAKLGFPGLSPEGQFFAETYRFPAGTTDVRFLRRAKRLLDRVLAEEWAGRAPDLPLDTPYDALILASIVEKETAVAAERPRIAGVFLSRLTLGMRLQTDPTVIYGMGAAFDGDIRRRDLVADTPWNTYTRAGLPPTPIAMVGREAIRAVLQPEATSSLYFVARGDGTHQFSDTLAAHEAAVREYQLGR